MTRMGVLALTAVYMLIAIMVYGCSMLFIKPDDELKSVPITVLEQYCFQQNELEFLECMRRGRPMEWPNQFNVSGDR